jgi:hypothetical protein
LKVLASFADSFGRKTLDPGTPYLGYKLTGAHSAPYENLRVFVVKDYFSLVAVQPR